MVRLMDARYCFQTEQDESGEYRQFFVRASKHRGKLRITVDIHAPEGVAEGLEPEFLDAVKAAIDRVQNKLTVDELDEQVA